MAIGNTFDFNYKITQSKLLKQFVTDKKYLPTILKLIFATTPVFDEQLMYEFVVNNNSYDKLLGNIILDVINLMIVTKNKINNEQSTKSTVESLTEYQLSSLIQTGNFGNYSQILT